jgi:methyl-accepting chemotaxis protein-1 (serine sensor receptor)
MSLSIRGRVGLTSGLLTIALVAVGSLGLYGMKQSNDALQNTFKNQMPAAREIDEATLLAARERIAARNTIDVIGTDRVEPSISLALKLREQSDAQWRQYVGVTKSAESKARAAAAQEKRIALHRALDETYAAVRASDHARALQIVNTTLQTAFEELVSSNRGLQDYLNRRAETGYADATSTLNFVLILTALALLTGIGLAIYSWLSLQRAIGRPLSAALAHFDAISAGDLRTRIEVLNDDEMGQLMQGLATMRESLNGYVGTYRWRIDCDCERANRRRKPRLIVAHGRTGGFAAANRCEHGRTNCSSQTELRKCYPGKRFGPYRTRHCQTRKRDRR